MSGQSIRNIWCIGRNYAEHASELGNQVPSSPLVFLKAGSCLQVAKTELVFPAWIKELNYELELAFQWDENLNFSQGFLGIDFTERAEQARLQDNKHPWTLAKSFSGACALSEPFPLQSLDDLSSFEMELLLNGEKRQQSRYDEMIFSPLELKNHVEAHFPVCPGDLMLTGTPPGVGLVETGDNITVRCNFNVEQTWKVCIPTMRPTT